MMSKEWVVLFCRGSSVYILERQGDFDEFLTGSRHGYFPNIFKTSLARLLNIWQLKEKKG